MRLTPRTCGVIIVSLVALGCTTVPVTGRRQLTLIPESQMIAMSERENAAFMRSHRSGGSPSDAYMIRSVGLRLKAAVEKYFAAKSLLSPASGYDWEFNLSRDNEFLLDNTNKITENIKKNSD